MYLLGKRYECVKCKLGFRSYKSGLIHANREMHPMDFIIDKSKIKKPKRQFFRPF